MGSTGCELTLQADWLFPGEELDKRAVLVSLGYIVAEITRGEVANRVHCGENAHLERSHRTDDEEFYIPRVLQIKSEADLLNEAMGYIYYYDNVRGHSSLSYQTPFAYLKSQLPDLDDKIRFVIPIMLDKVSVELGPWSGYHVLAQHLAMFP